MRRNLGNIQNDDMGNKIIKYSTIGVIILTIIAIALIAYSQNLTKEVKEGALSSEEIANIVNRTNEVTSEEVEEASSEMGKSVEEAENEIENTLTTTTTENNTSLNTTNIVTNVNTPQQTEIPTQSNNETPAKKEEVKELNFAKPVEGEVVKEYAKENLVFSDTLQEWTVHTGIDIKAEKTTVVKSAEDGIVKSIKNDPRYGLTIVVEHENGFQTVYSNLLTSEFVVEGEKVKKEQSIGTVGNTAAFESAEEAHLHFEILKDNIQVDPSIYIKY